MYLTKEEEKAYDGEYGWAQQIAMKILVKLGELFGATKLIPIESAHISGVSYKSMGDSIDFLATLASEKGRAQVLSTLNPASFDPQYLVDKIPSEYKKKQLRIIDLYKKMGIKPTLTCTPYYIHRPLKESHVAWAESSAVMYANSVLGSWTNREGSPSALAASLIGKTPNHGMHQAENRQPDVLVKVEFNPTNGTEFGALGYYVGKTLKDKIPLFEGLFNYTDDDLKQLGGGMATGGMTSMFYTHGEYEGRRLDTLSIEPKAIKRIIESLSTASEKPNLIFIGCPHCSQKELQIVARLLEGKKVKKGTEFWVCTSRYIREKAKDYVDMIEKAGGRVLCDTCAIVTWIKDLGITTMMTNSAKAAYYAPTFNGVNVTLAPLSQCITAICQH